MGGAVSTRNDARAYGISDLTENAHVYQLSIVEKNDKVRVRGKSLTCTFGAGIYICTGWFRTCLDRNLYSVDVLY